MGEQAKINETWIGYAHTVDNCTDTDAVNNFFMLYTSNEFKFRNCLFFFLQP